MNAPDGGGATGGSCEYVRRAKALLRETALLAGALAALLLAALAVGAALAVVASAEPLRVYP